MEHQTNKYPLSNELQWNVYLKKNHTWKKLDRHHLILASIKLALIYPPLSDEDVFNTTREWSSAYKPKC